MNKLDIYEKDFDLTGKQTLEIISKANRFNKWMYDEIKPFLKGEILEIGSGIGNISKYVIEDGYNITLSDYDSGYYSYLKKKFLPASNVKGILQLDLLDPDFENRFGYAKQKFDTVFLLNVIEHLTDDQKAIYNCQFLLKPGGHLIILAPAYSWLYCKIDENLGHYRRYTLTQMKDVVENKSFEIIYERYFNFLGMAGWLVFGKILRKKKLGNEMGPFNAIVPLAKLFDKIVRKRAGLSVIIAGKKTIH